MEALLIKNIGTIVTGDLSKPLLEAEAVYIEGEHIKKIGPLSEMPVPDKATVIDANGLTLCPGLIDAHIHPVLGDYLPAFKAVDWLDGYVNGGVTGMVSAGEIYVPGFPSNVSGVKALAIASKHTWDNYHPCGARVHAGAVMLTRGLTEGDFQELRREGIRVVGEVGMSEVKDPTEAKVLVEMAKSQGFTVLAHSGGTSIPGSASFKADDIIQIAPDVVCHLNGAPTPMASDDVRRVIEEGDFFFDVISSGNVKTLLKILGWTLDGDRLHRMLLGTNAPSMAGFSPLGLWMLMGALCISSDLSPAEAIAMATGNVARCYGLDHGLVAEGWRADLLLCSTPAGSVKKDALETIKSGRVPSVAMVIIGGKVTLTYCRNTAPPSRRPVVLAN